ncbi:MAG TPA: acyl-homoserine-lactone synthase [Tahibacter sp.]|nr:acyl-homoserine-lactone synthase [Tahibacter sp.]
MTYTLVGKVGNGVEPAHLDGMFRVRREQFAERLGWDVSVDPSGREFDFYDTIGPVYVLALDDESERCVGGLRLLPTTGPNMLKDIFRETLRCESFVPSRNVWEISRLAVAGNPAEGGFGFGETPASLIRAMLAEASRVGLTALVGVTTTSVTRMMRGFGLDVERLGEPAVIGSARSVAFRLPISDRMLQRVGVPVRRRAA